MISFLNIPLGLIPDTIICLSQELGSYHHFTLTLKSNVFFFFLQYYMFKIYVQN